MTGITPTLLHVAGPHVPARESGQAAARAGRMGLPLRIVPVDPLETPEVRANGRERCYFCKRALFARLSGEARAVAEAAGFTDVRIADDLAGRPRVLVGRKGAGASAACDAAFPSEAR